MALNKITDMAFRNLKAKDTVQTIADGGGLMVRVRAKKDGGAISFMLSYRIDGKQQRMTLKAKGLVDARIERDEIKEIVRQGKDPSLERSLKLEREKQQQLNEQAALTKLQARITVRDLFVNWCDTDLLNRKDIAEIRRMFQKDILPDLGGLFVEDVRKGHVSLLIGKLKKRGVNHLARNLLKLIRQMFRFAVTYDMIEFDPTASLSIAKMTTKPTERDRTLSDIEIRALARQLPDAHLIKSTECAVWIALSTMCRIGEISKAKFSDLDFELKTWTIPKENSKNKKAHTIYLSDFALEYFKVLTNVASNNIWLFPNRYGSSHVSEKSISKQLGGRQSDNILSNRSKDNQALVLTGGKWTPHDLRRTGATIMGDLGIPPDVTEKCLNHAEENKIKRIYQRQKLEAEQAEAWRALGDRLSLLVNMDDSNVVLLHQRN